MDTPKSCPNCGTEIPPDAPGGWCPRCTFQQLAQEEADEYQGALSLHDIPQPGATVSYIGDYELLEIIAHGGMGVVYKARQKSLNRIVALKLLLGGVHASEDFKQRFRQEAELAAQLHHPNIVGVYEAGIHEGQPYFSMEYVPGHDLATLTQGNPLPPKQACEYLKTIAEAVHHAHVQGVLHRDLKPSNILLGVDGRLRITDFGLAKRFADSSPLTLSGATLGTPGYLPPEQVSTRRGTVGVTSDVYSLGAILYHLLTGRAPFQGEAPADVLMQVLNEPPVLPSEINPLVPMEQEAICLKCLAKDPGQRFSSAKELAQAFDESVLNSRNVLTGKIRIFRYFIARNAFFVGLATILFAGAMWFGLARLKQHGVMGGLGRPDRLTNSLGMVFVPAPDTNLLFSIWHTRVQDFAAFVKETGYEATNGVLSRPPEGWKRTGNSWLNPGFNQGPTHPVCGVSWEDAQAFCTWLTGKEQREGRLSLNQKYRLPTDAEWSVAVGLGAEEGDLPFVKSRRIDHVYPWGNQWPPPEGAANLHPKLGVDTFTWTSPVGSFKPNPFGLHDMGGNVWQWCEDWYDPNQRVRVKRGSSWLQPERTNALSSTRYRDEPGVRLIDNGFRVVLDSGEARVHSEINPHPQPAGTPRDPVSSLHIFSRSNSLAMLESIAAKPIFLRVDSEPREAYCYVYPKGMRMVVTYEYKEPITDELPIHGRTPLAISSSKLKLVQAAMRNSGVEAFIFKPGFEPAVISKEEMADELDLGVVTLKPLTSVKPARITAKQLLSAVGDYVGRMVELEGTLTTVSPASERFRRLRSQTGKNRNSLEKLPAEVVVFSFGEPPYNDLFLTYIPFERFAGSGLEGKTNGVVYSGPIQFYVPVAAFNAPLRNGPLVEIRRLGPAD